MTSLLAGPNSLYLANGQPTTCDSTCCQLHFQARSCANNALANLWVAIPPGSPQLTFVHTNGLCYYVSTSHPSTTDLAGKPIAVVTQANTVPDCAACGVYRQAIRCSDGAPMNLWRADPLLSLPYYFYKSGRGCGAFLSSTPTSLTPGPLLSGDTPVTGCSDQSPPGTDCAINSCCQDAPAITSWIVTVSGLVPANCGNGDIEMFSGSVPNGTWTVPVTSFNSANCWGVRDMGNVKFRRCSTGTLWADFNVSLTVSHANNVFIPFGLTLNVSNNCGYGWAIGDTQKICRGETVSGTFGGFACQPGAGFFGGPINFSVTRGN